MRVLIADDEFVSRKKLQLIFSNYGTCDVALDGAEALDKFYQASQDKQPYNLCILDMEMPRKKGVEVIEEIRNWETEHSRKNPRYQPVKILVITGKENFDSIMAAYGKGTEGYLIKPINQDKVQAALSDIGLVSKTTLTH